MEELLSLSNGTPTALNSGSEEGKRLCVFRIETTFSSSLFSILFHFPSSITADFLSLSLFPRKASTEETQGEILQESRSWRSYRTWGNF